MLIFDLGGGAFDLSVWIIEGGIFLRSNQRLEIDILEEKTLITEWWITEFKRRHKKDIKDNKRELRRLRTACDRAKRTLSASA